MCVYIKWCVFNCSCFCFFFSPWIFIVTSHFFSSPLTIFSIWPCRWLFPINHSQTYLGALWRFHMCPHASRKCYLGQVWTVDLFMTLSSQTWSIGEGRGIPLGLALGSGEHGTGFGLASSPTPHPDPNHSAWETLISAFQFTGHLALSSLICFPISTSITPIVISCYLWPTSSTPSPSLIILWQTWLQWHLPPLSLPPSPRLLLPCLPMALSTYNLKHQVPLSATSCNKQHMSLDIANITWRVRIAPGREPLGQNTCNVPFHQNGTKM